MVMWANAFFVGNMLPGIPGDGRRWEMCGLQERRHGWAPRLHTRALSGGQQDWHRVGSRNQGGTMQKPASLCSGLLENHSYREDEQPETGMGAGVGGGVDPFQRRGTGGKRWKS